MALSYIQYAGTGSATSFNIPFQYLSRSHVTVTVDGVITPFAWVSANQVSVSPAPSKGAVVEIRRTTPRDKLLVDFVDGSVLTEGDLDTAALQAFFLAQEAFDLTGATLGLTSDGAFSAYNRRIANVAPPRDPNDAISKAYHEGTLVPQLQSLLSQTITAKNDADIAKSQANAARDTAIGYRDETVRALTASEAARDRAVQAETNSEQSAASSTASKERAVLAESNSAHSASTASDKASQAQSAASTALQQAGVAQGHKDAASQSAENAAGAASQAGAHRQKAQDWAEKPEDVAVETGMFSAKHWAAKAQKWAATMLLPVVVAGSFLRGKADLSGWETRTPAQMRSDLSLGQAAVLNPSGIINTQTYSDSGSATSAVTFVNVNTTNFVYAPKSNNSIIHLLCTFQGEVTNVVGANTEASYRLVEGSSVVGFEAKLSAPSGSGNTGIRLPITLQATISNTSTASRIFNIQAANSGAAASTAYCHRIAVLIVERPV